MSLRDLLNRLLPSLALLIGLVLVLDACDARRARSNAEDDDDATSANDDDSAQQDDDDTTGDDDDDTGGDDDTGDDDTGDDDDDDTTIGDDDDGSAGILDLSADTTSFGSVTIGSPANTTVYFENLGGTGITATVTLSDLSGVWILQGGTTVNIAPLSTETRNLVFNPAVAQAYSLAMDVNHDGANSSPQQLLISGVGTGGSGGTETSCTDGVDNDGDTLVDCADPECATDPACTGGADPCCSPNPQFQNGPCQNTTNQSCACSSDPFCCTDWDQTCSNIYDGSTGHCGPSATCGP